MTRTHPARRLVGIALLLVVIAAACGDDDSSDDALDTEPTIDDTEPTTAAACDSTVSGSELNYAVFAPTGNLDPTQSPGTLVGGTETAAVWDVLMRWDPDSGEWEPQLAESLTPDDTFTEYTLTLREGVTYANGDTMVAQDVIDSMQRFYGEARNSSRAFLDYIDFDATEVVDDRTIVFRLVQPWSGFPYVLGDEPGMVVNPRVVAAAGVDDNGVSLVGFDPAGANAGPYSVESFNPGESPYLVLKARDDYWGGPVCIETINFQFILGDQAKLDALELGESDAAFLRTPDAIIAARDAGYTDLTSLQSAGGLLMINNGRGTANPITSDVRFRRAAAAALDGAAISERALGGGASTFKGILDPASEFFSDAIGELPTDPELATSLVEELRSEGWDGTIRLLCADSNPDLTVALAAALEAVGMTVDAQTTDLNTQLGGVIGFDYDLACWGLNLSDSDLQVNLMYNLSSDSASNRTGYANPAMDAAIDALFAAEDLEAAQAAMGEISEIWLEDVPSVVYGALEEGLVATDGVSGIVPTQASIYLFHDAHMDD